MSQLKGILTDHYQQRNLPRSSTIWDGYWRVQENEEGKRGYSSQRASTVILSVCSQSQQHRHHFGKLLQVNPTSYLADPEGVGPRNLCFNKPCRWMLYTPILKSSGLKISNLKEKCWVWRTSSSSVWLHFRLRTVVKMEDENIGKRARCDMWPLMEFVLSQWEW